MVEAAEVRSEVPQLSLPFLEVLEVAELVVAVALAPALLERRDKVSLVVTDQLPLSAEAAEAAEREQSAVCRLVVRPALAG